MGPHPRKPDEQDRAEVTPDVDREREPHHELNNPITEPDPTEWPDPYEKRDDPRDPPDPDGRPFGEGAHPQTGAESTSAPHPDEDPEAPDAEPPERDKLDE
jgi:hypothetical protein